MSDCCNYLKNLLFIMQHYFNAEKYIMQYYLFLLLFFWLLYYGSHKISMVTEFLL